MTKEERKNTSSQILTKMEDSSKTGGQDESLKNIVSAIESDDVNRKEFLQNNNSLNAYYTELVNSYGLFFLYDLTLPISNVTYFDNGEFVFTGTDSQDLWDASTLLKNMFYVPYNTSQVYELQDLKSEKLILDPEQKVDYDGTSNNNPIIPPRLKNILPYENDGLNEKTVINLLTWAKGVYTTGYRIGYPYFTIVFFPEDNKIVYSISNSAVDSSFVVNDYVVFNDGANVFVGKITEKNYDVINGGTQYAHYIKILKQSDTSVTNYLTYTSEIKAGSDKAKNLIFSLMIYWRQLLEEQVEQLETIPNKSSTDTNQIAVLNSAIADLDYWFNLDVSVKYNSTNLNYITGLFSARTTAINERKAFLYTNNTKLKSLMEKRNDLITLRVKKRGGTMNKIHRENVSYFAQVDQKQADEGSFEYFRKKLIVKRIIEDCVDTKIVYIKDNNLVNNSKLYNGDIVYVVSDTQMEIKTFIAGIADAVREDKMDKTSIKKEMINVKKITLANRIPSSYITNENVRLMKELE